MFEDGIEFSGFTTHTPLIHNESLTPLSSQILLKSAPFVFFCVKVGSNQTFHF